MMSTHGGRALLRRTIEYSGAFASTFDIDTHRHAYNAGKRQVGLHLIEQLESACPDKYLQLLEERYDD